MPHTPGPWSYEFKSIQDDWGEIRAAGRRLVAKCVFGYSDLKSAAEAIEKLADEVEAKAKTVIAAVGAT